MVLVFQKLWKNIFWTIQKDKVCSRVRVVRVLMNDYDGISSKIFDIIFVCIGFQCRSEKQKHICFGNFICHFCNDIMVEHFTKQFYLWTDDMSTFFTERNRRSLFHKFDWIFFSAMRADVFINCSVNIIHIFTTGSLGERKTVFRNDGL